MARVSNVNISNEGTYFTYYPDPDPSGKDFDLRILSTASAPFKAAMRERSRSNPTKTRPQKVREDNRFADDAADSEDLFGNLNDEELLDLMQFQASTLLVGWRGAEMSRGELAALDQSDVIGDPGEIVQVDFTAKRGAALLNAEGYSDMIEFVLEKGRKLSAHVRAHTEAAVKN